MSERAQPADGYRKRKGQNPTTGPVVQGLTNNSANQGTDKMCDGRALANLEYSCFQLFLLQQCRKCRPRASYWPLMPTVAIKVSRTFSHWQTAG